jgi:hypothetical protein
MIDISIMNLGKIGVRDSMGIKQSSLAVVVYVIE